MKPISRFHVVGIDADPEVIPSDGGKWVRFTDHEATIATLRAERDDWRSSATDFKGLCDEWQARAEAAEASLAEVATALPFLDRLARALKNKNGGKYNDAWTDDGYTLSGMVSAFRTALARLDTPEKK